MIKKIIPVFGFIVITAIFFWQFLLKGLVPLPADTVVGLYYPYRDNFVKTNPNGLPFKNSLITDPVRQQYPWKSLAIQSYREGDLPTWNSYSFSGTPNLANFQSAVLYPFNIILFIGSFDISWSFLIMLQPLLAGIFLYFYLRNLKLDEYSSFLGGIVFAFCGFSVTWLEWGNILHTGLWLPLILLSIDKVLSFKKRKEIILWCFIFIFSLSSSFFAGHLQTFFYIFVFTAVYAILRFIQNKKVKSMMAILTSVFVSFIIMLPQLIPTLNFILLSGREADQLVWQKEGWFMPWQHLVQFLIPDFFGNPTTLNYWGTWNYGELTGYVGIVAFILAMFAIIFRRDKKTLFFGGAILISLLFALPNIVSKIPYLLNIPFISTAQPTRLLFIIDFSLSVLAALGLNYLIKSGKVKQILLPIAVVGTIFIIVFIYLQFLSNGQNMENIAVSKRNLYFPGLIFVISSIALLVYSLIKKKLNNYLLVLIILVAVVELFRFSWKFNSFSERKYLYPNSPSIELVRNNIGSYRFATNDSRVLPPNFSIMHNLQSVEGYDPLYLERYGELIAAINRNEPNIKPPFGFNRIVRVENFSSNIIDLMGIKYVFSLTEMNVPGFVKVFDEGGTKVYQNTEVLPRAFFVNELKIAKDKNEAIKLMFDSEFDPLSQAVVEERINGNFTVGQARISRFSNQNVVIETDNDTKGFLVLTDTYYPTWKVKINGKDSKIYRTDFNFRGVVVPKGKNIIEFSNGLL